jgi:hypothetical protein
LRVFDQTAPDAEDHAQKNPLDFLPKVRVVAAEPELREPETPLFVLRRSESLFMMAAAW